MSGLLKFLGSIILFTSIIHAENSVIEYFKHFIKKNAINEGANFKKLHSSGIEHFSQNRYRQAAKLFGRAGLQSPYHPVNNLYFAISLFGINEYALGGQIARKLLIIKNWENIPLNINKILENQKEYQKMLTKFEKWLFRESRNLDCYFLFGFLCQFSGEPDKAELAYRMILKKNYLDYDSRVLLSLITGKSITLTPSYPQLQQDIDILLSQKSNYLALAKCITAYTHYPHQKNIHYKLSYILSVVGYWKQASHILQIAIQKYPKLIKSQKDFHKKVDMSWLGKLEKYVQKNSGEKDILFLLGYYYSMLGEFNKTRLILKHLQKHNYKKKVIIPFSKFVRKNFPK